MSNRDANLAAIKEGLYSISKHLTSAPKARTTNETKALASKLYNSLQQNNNPVERFYFIYLLCQICSSEKLNKVCKLMKIIFPTQPTPQSLALISDMISFALCHPSQYASILDNLGTYVYMSESVHIYMESWHQAQTLALDSPGFCSALFSRDDLIQLEIGKKILAKWLQDLSKTDQDFPLVNLNQIIKYSLFDSGNSESTSEGTVSTTDQLDSDLHYGILTVIQSKRCQTLTNQFLIDIVTNLSQRLDVSINATSRAQTNLIVDWFAQILSVSAASKVTSITNTLKASLMKLESNQIIAAIIKWPIK